MLYFEKLSLGLKQLLRLDINIYKDVTYSTILEVSTLNEFNYR